MKKVFFLVAVGLIALIALSLLSCGPEESKYLYIIVSNGGIPAYYMQEDLTWCGAACIQMWACFLYPTFPMDQAQIMFSADTEYPFGWLSEYEVCAFMNNYVSPNGFAVYESYASTFLWNTKQSINANQPFICGMYGNHWVFVTGYQVAKSNVGGDPTAIVYADPARMCNSDSSSCYGAFYAMNTNVFLNFTGTPVIYIAVFNAPLKKEMFPPVVDSSAYPPLTYANYYNYKALAKGVPGPDYNNIPFADGNNGIPNPLETRIIQAAESTLAVWGTQELVGLDPDYANQFVGAYPASVELVTNMAYLRFGSPEDFPCPINCGGQTFWVVTYTNASSYVGSVRVKLASDSATFESGGISGFVSASSAKAYQTGSSGANKLATVSGTTGFITRKELHRMFPECTFYPFWDLNELTATPFIPFWYVQRPNGTRFILNSWGQEMVRDANSGVLLLKSGQAKQSHLPEKLSLSQNYPNPFNPETHINFAVPSFSHVKVEIFNVLGQRIKTLVSGEYQAGNYRIVWDGTNSNGEKVSSGIYLYKLQVGAETVSKKMILTK